MEFPQRINAYDAFNRCFIGGTLKKQGERVFFVKNSEFPYDTSLYISPGFLDMHVHVFEGYGIFGMDPRQFGHSWVYIACPIVGLVVLTILSFSENMFFLNIKMSLN